MNEPEIPVRMTFDGELELAIMVDNKVRFVPLSIFGATQLLRDIEGELALYFARQSEGREIDLRTFKVGLTDAD